MRKELLALALLSCVCGIASAQTDTQPPPAQDFATAKAQHIARLEQELSCVQAATTVEAMRACMPHRDGHMGPPPQH